MKKFLIGVFAVALIISTHASAQTVSPDSGNTSTFFAARLDASSSGIIVKELQQILQQKGFFNGPLNGKYGPLTAAAVKQFQSANGLAPVGTVGPKTRDLLNASLSTSNTTGVVSQGIIATPVLACTPTSAPSVTVLSPNGGETFTDGQAVTVKWTSCNIPQNASIALNVITNQMDDGFGLQNAQHNSILANDGKAIVTFPVLTQLNNWNYGTYYKIRILATYSNGYVYDDSDNLFTINSSQSSSCTINALSTGTPTINSGESATLGFGATGCVTLLLQGDNGTSLNIPMGSTAYATGPLTKTTTYTLYGASSLYPDCLSLLGYSTKDGQPCTKNAVSKSLTITVNGTTAGDTTPRIMYWWGKVNQHVDAQGNWQTDPDGVSGADLDKLTYCKKWYPNTTSVEPYKSETISTWHERGNVNNWPATITSDKCVQGVTNGLSVDLKINGSDTPSPVQFLSKMTASWTSTGANTCTLSGNHVQGWDGGPMWNGQIVGTSGSMDLKAGSYNTGNNQIEFVNPLSIGIQCFDQQKGTNVIDKVSIPLIQSSLDTTPRIAYWYGKVNQHVDSTGTWTTDPDGTSGANLDQLTYCKKWYPNTTSVAPYKSETITDWKRAIGYEQSNYTATETSQQCVQGSSSGKVLKVTTEYVNLPGPTATSAYLVGSWNYGASYITPSSLWFEYGTTQSLGSKTSLETPGTPGDPNRDSLMYFGEQNLNTLTPNTLYYFKACGNSSDTGTVCGQTMNFKTLDASSQSSSCTINSFTANPTTVDWAGSTGTTVTWSTTGCNNVYLDNNFEGSGDRAKNGTQGYAESYFGGHTGMYTITLSAVSELYPGCSGVSGYSPVDGQPCSKNTAVKTVSINVIDSRTSDTTPRIAYWYGKVNQHVDANGIWTTDPDGVSGADLDKLTYCKKWYPNTVQVEPYKQELITDWKRAIGYEQSNYSATVQSYICDPAHG